MSLMVITVLATLAILALICIRGFADAKAHRAFRETRPQKPAVRLFTPPAYSGRGYDLVRRSLGKYDAETRKAMIEADTAPQAASKTAPKPAEAAPKVAKPETAALPVPPKKASRRRKRRARAVH